MDYREIQGVMYVEIDPRSGFCHGVVNAITKAEQALEENKVLYCLGDIVHNTAEVERLRGMGLNTINSDTFSMLENKTVLLRAHGEPPSTYALAAGKGIRIIDATCPVVLRLQQRVKEAHGEMKKSNGQVAIYGKHGHAEVVGLVGHANDEAIVISSTEELGKIDFNRPLTLFSQTTQNVQKYHAMAQALGDEYAKHPGIMFRWHDTICRQVANRDIHLKEFSRQFDTILFVSDSKSSNGSYLFSICKQENPATYFISSPSDIDRSLFTPLSRVGICGATSTPKWLMEKIRGSLHAMFEE